MATTNTPAVATRRFWVAAGAASTLDISGQFLAGMRRHLHQHAGDIDEPAQRISAIRAGQSAAFVTLLAALAVCAAGVMAGHAWLIAVPAACQVGVVACAVWCHHSTRPQHR